jgi:hypothetical protein
LNLRRSVVFLFVYSLQLAFGWEFNNPIHYVTSVRCPENVELQSILTSSRLFFTVPSAQTADGIMLWYADNTGVHSLDDIQLDYRYLAEISPDGSNILFVQTSVDTASDLRHVFDFGGGYLARAWVMNTSTFVITELMLPAEIKNIKFSRRVFWKEENIAILFSVPDERVLLTIDISSETLAVGDWPSLPDLDLSYPGGNFLPSPIGTEFYLYTVSSPLIGHPYELAWRVSNREGQVISNYVIETGASAIWLSDGSGVLVQETQFENGQIAGYAHYLVSFGGAVSQLRSSTQNLTDGVVNGDSSMVAYLDWREGEIGSSHNLAILRLPSGENIVTCERNIMNMGGWSLDSHLLSYVEFDDESFSVSVFDVNRNVVASIPIVGSMTYPSAELGIRIIGWSVH